MKRPYVAIALLIVAACRTVDPPPPPAPRVGPSPAATPPGGVNPAPLAAVALFPCPLRASAYSALKCRFGVAGGTVEPPLRAPHERDHLVHPRIVEAGHALEGRFEAERRAQKQAVALLEGAELGGRHAGPAQAHDVEAAGAARHAVGDDEG